MIDADNELDRFRQRMTSDNILPHDEINDIVYDTLGRINEAILMSVSESVAEIVDHAISIEAEEFLEDMELVENGHYWSIVTKSGKTDYSTSPEPMLPQLLKNAETAMDGSKYKVIPVGKGTNKPSRRLTSLHDVLQRRQSDIDDARAALHKKTMSGRSAKANDMASEFKAIINRTLQERAEFYKGAMEANKAEVTAPAGKQEYRVASSKQDAAEQWVQPGKSIDMTGVINDANAKLLEQYSEAVLVIIEAVEHEYLDLIDTGY